MKTWGVVSLLCGSMLSPGCRRWRGVAPDAASAVQFVEATSPAGLKFVHNSGRAGKKFLPETHGLRRRVLRRRRRRLARHPARQRQGLDAARAASRCRRSTATTATARSPTSPRGSGLDVEMYGMGVAVGDYDNDGRDDVYITALEGDRLFHNEGDGKFRDVTKAAGIDNAQLRHQRRLARLRPRRQARPVRRQLRPVEPREATSGARSTAPPSPTARRSRTRARRRSCSTTSAAASSRTSASKAGVGDPTSKSLGVAVLDYNGDGWPDLFVANDTQPNKLYRNNQNGTFTEEGVAAGVAFGEDGVARGAMGVDAADYDRSGPPAPAGRQLLQPDARPLSQRRQRPVRGRGAALDRRAAPAC